MRCLRIALLLMAACPIWETEGHAECVTLGPESMKWPGSGFVFDGTVLQLNDAGVALLQVHRVFKGQLPARIELYVWPGMEYPTLVAGQRYVLAIQRMKPPGFPTAVPHRPFEPEPPEDPTLVYGTLQCGAMPRDSLQRDGTLDGFGRGWPPGR